MNMTQEEIQSLLLWHYLFAVEAVKDCEEFVEALRLIDDLCVDEGVCLCAFELCDADIVDEIWVNRNITDDNFSWGPNPSETNTIPEIIERLQIRIDILQKELTA